jgi:hypothetical protein
MYYYYIGTRRTEMTLFTAEEERKLIENSEHIKWNFYPYGIEDSSNSCECVPVAKFLDTENGDTWYITQLKEKTDWESLTTSYPTPDNEDRNLFGIVIYSTATDSDHDDIYMSSVRESELKGMEKVINFDTNNSLDEITKAHFGELK